jgi:hypothetical protein
VKTLPKRVWRDRIPLDEVMYHSILVTINIQLPRQQVSEKKPF